MKYGQFSRGTHLLSSDHLAYFLGIPWPLEQDTVNWSSIFYSGQKNGKSFSQKGETYPAKEALCPVSLVIYQTMRVAWRQLSTYKDEVRSYEHG